MESIKNFQWDKWTEGNYQYLESLDSVFGDSMVRFLSNIDSIAIGIAMIFVAEKLWEVAKRKFARKV